MNTVIQRASFPEGRRVLVMSDLHAHREGFHFLLKRAGFTENDILVIVGDILEKGPDSLGLLRDLMRLKKTHAVHTLMGNVDYWRLSGLISDDEKAQKDLLLTSIAYKNWWPSGILFEMLSELGIPMTEDLDTKSVFPVLRDRFREELAFLSSCPAILEAGNKIFVHGGIPHEDLHEFENEERHRFLKWDRFMESDVSFRKTVVVGHWPVTLYSKSFPSATPVYDQAKNILVIDGGCGVKKEGQINLLIFPSVSSDTYELVTWDGLPTVTALDFQKASCDFGYIRWGDDEVEVVETSKKEAVILHHGKRMTIPIKNLREKNGAFRADEFTDYRLPVSAGDTLSVIEETENGLYAKKNGVTGWYFGRYQ